VSTAISARPYNDHFFNKIKETEMEKLNETGLIIVKDFIEKQNAQIRVQSKTGEGSTFTILFKNTNV
jgi:light-regulated signal transduction histidine kinase (bacteriophytochrome)